MFGIGLPPFVLFGASLLGGSFGCVVLFSDPVLSNDSNQSHGWGAFGEDYTESRSYIPPKRSPNYAFGPRAFPPLMNGGPRPLIRPQATEQIVFPNTERSGTILIDTAGRKLYLTLSTQFALVYPISVGREGFTWTGTEKISRIAAWPDWHPPKEMRERDPRLPKKMLGGIRNPLGAKALFLGRSLYRIHGTNDPKTIGRAASSGCFRMLNGHVLHLASMVSVGTTVKVLPSLAARAASLDASLKGRIGSTASPTLRGRWVTRTYPTRVFVNR
jgi:lipoprotein-anchoring transpeptidase ErfK/SrfK